MALAGDAVEDDRGRRRGGPVAGEAAEQRRDRGALAADIDDQNNRPPGNPGQIGGRAGFAVGSGAVEEAHDALAQHDLGRGLELGDGRGERRRAHRPDVEVAAGRAAGQGVKGRIDEIGPGLRRGRRHAATPQTTQ